MPYRVISHPYAYLNGRDTESGGLVETFRTIIREVPGSIPGASFLGEGPVVVLHHQANAEVDPT